MTFAIGQVSGYFIIKGWFLNEQLKQLTPVMENIADNNSNVSESSQEKSTALSFNKDNYTTQAFTVNGEEVTFKDYVKSYIIKSAQAGLNSGTDLSEVTWVKVSGNTVTDIAKNWRIRHGAKDSDTAISTPTILALQLKATGAAVDFAVPWGQGHGGDYDLNELFEWTDSILE